MKYSSSKWIINAWYIENTMQKTIWNQWTLQNHLIWRLEQIDFKEFWKKNMSGWESGGNNYRKINLNWKSRFEGQYDMFLLWQKFEKWKLDHKEDCVPKNWCFRTVVLEKTLKSPLDSKEIKPGNPKGNQPWIFIGRMGAEAPIL